MTPAATGASAGPRGRVLVTGAGGLVGRLLVERLRAGGWQVVSAVRRAARAADEVAWDPQGGTMDLATTAPLAAVVHLAGENLAAGRWTEARRAAIRDSRVLGTRTVVRALAQLPEPQRPAVLVSASAVGVYGDAGDTWLDEQAPAGRSFLADVCVAWEAEAEAAADAGLRVVMMRTAMVLAAEGGALAKLLPVFRRGLGGPAGGGGQWLSWIGRDDLCAAYLHALGTPALRGAVNAVAPAPVTNAGFAAALGGVLGRPARVPAPAFALRAMFGAMADETILASQRVRPARLVASGFSFRHPDLAGALRHELMQTPGRGT